MHSPKSHIPKKISRAWVEVDVASNTLGRVSTKIANLLRGKHKRDFTPHIDMGDYVVAVNVDKIKLTGNKIQQKKYYHYSGYPGGLRTKELKHLIIDKPDQVLRAAVFNMLDDNKLRKTAMRRLKMVSGPTHNYKIEKKA